MTNLCHGDELELVDLAVVVGRDEVDRQLQVEDELRLREDPALRLEEEPETNPQLFYFFNVAWAGERTRDFLISSIFSFPSIV
jgi:hypothetical protein